MNMQNCYVWLVTQPAIDGTKDEVTITDHAYNELDNIETNDGYYHFFFKNVTNVSFHNVTYSDAYDMTISGKNKNAHLSPDAAMSFIVTTNEEEYEKRKHSMDKGLFPTPYIEIEL